MKIRRPKDRPATPPPPPPPAIASPTGGPDVTIKFTFAQAQLLYAACRDRLKVYDLEERLGWAIMPETRHALSGLQVIIANAADEAVRQQEAAAKGAKTDAVPVKTD